MIPSGKKIEVRPGPDGGATVLLVDVVPNGGPRKAKNGAVVVSERVPAVDLHGAVSALDLGATILALIAHGKANP